MPVSQLLELAQAGKIDEFENRCLEHLVGGTLSLSQLGGAFEHLERAGQPERVAALAQMIFDNIDLTVHAPAALKLARIALQGAPGNDAIREMAVSLYRQVYGSQPGFDVVLGMSGLAGGRPPRMALKLLDLCLALKPGDTLINRMDDRVVEVTEIDRVNGLFTLRQAGRTTTRPAPEVVRDFDPIASDDFRVLRQLRPQELPRLVQEDPVALVIGLIHAHGEMIDADLLKHELVPKYLPAGEWSAWWTRTRNLLKRNPHVVMEGRSPIILSYCAEGMTLEEETWDTFTSRKEPVDWLAIIEGYLREKAARKEPPDAELMRRFSDHLVSHAEAVARMRPADALACGLIADRLAGKGLPADPKSLALAGELLAQAEDPGLLLRDLTHEGLRERGLEILREVRPDDWAAHAVSWLPTAPASLVDKIAGAAIAAGRRDEVQRFVDTGLGDVARHPELVYWLWKGPGCAAELNLPSDDELFRMILDTLSTLGRTVSAEPEIVRAFRQRAKAALALRDYAKVCACLSRTTEAAAITIRRQMQRLEGLGATAPARLLDILRDYHPALWAVAARRLDPWEDQETLWTTAGGLARRTAERDELVHKKMPENAKRIGEAASHGDLSENSEYKFALEERDLLRARLAKLNDELSRARVLEVHDVPDDRVGIGSRVTVARSDGAGEQVMTFFGPFDGDVERGIYSYLAPVSQRLMGCRVGDRVDVTLDGRAVQLEIVRIENALERPRESTHV